MRKRFQDVRPGLPFLAMAAFMLAMIAALKVSELMGWLS
jgi:hypothetical protein